MPLIEDISVVFLYVNDLERSLTFYRDLCGLPFDDRQGDWVNCTLPSGMRFAMHDSYPGREPQTPGTAVISFAVRKLSSVVEHLRGAGVVVGEPVREAYGAFVEILDPDGYRIQLFEPAAP